MLERQIINNIIETKKYNTNKIATSKYTYLNFVPKNIQEQFKKLANIYFLIIGFLQIIQEISISQGQPVIFLPLFVILCISALKDLLEDLKRHKSDDEENKRLILVYRKEAWIQIHWQDLIVGEIIKVMKDEYIPADIICLFSSDQARTCYIETKNLDGETNLKRKVVDKDLQNYGSIEILQAKLQFNLEKPNPYLYNFQGEYFKDESLKQGSQVPLDINNFILRGSSLRNTHYIIGITAYTGNDTKIMLNSIKARPKKSKVERKMNFFIACIFILQILICLGNSIYSLIWFMKNKKYLINYLGLSSTDKLDNSMFHLFLIQWGTWILIFTNFVPISLIVTLEMVRFFQGIIIQKDQQTFSLVNDIQCSVQSSSLNEELGQVEYVFSDKTGTLTNNVMNFKCLTINGISYGEKNNLSQKQLNQLKQVTNVQFKDNSLFQDLESKDSQSQHIIQSILMLSVCHTVIVENTSSGSQFNASSPDELALINFAKFCGFEYIGVDEENIIKVKQGEQIHKFKLLHVLEFNSSRKRMSLIVQNQQGQIVLYCKGADNIIFSRLDQKNNNELSISQTKQNINKYFFLFVNFLLIYFSSYAKIGLRTLVLAQRFISQDYYEKWNEEYNKALCLLTNRQEKLEEIQNQIEQNLMLLGATAIDDMLQDDVASTIQSMKQAGIKVWVLTGDKVESAISIAFSCQLLNTELKQLTIDGQNQVEVEKQLKDFHKEVESEKEQFQKQNLKNLNKQNINKITLQIAVIITGDALIHSMADKELQKLLIQICSVSKVVLACRVSPKQKQEIVTLVRSHQKKVTTLAIGDGANDVNMINAAHVGIGIKGKEGQQAARASDFSVGEFKILLPLLFNHGRECYRRNTVLICYNFYKNMILVLPQWWYGFITGFSGSSLYDPWIYQLYNLCYTSLPIVIYAVFDEEFSAYYLQYNPSLYIQGIKGTLFNQKIFWEWILLGIWHALICSIASFGIMEQSFQLEGKQFFFAISGIVSFGASVLLGNSKVMLISNTHTIASILCIFGSILFFIMNHAFASTVFSSQDIYNTFNNAYNTPYFWLCYIFILALTISIDAGFERWSQYEQGRMNINFSKKKYNNNRSQAQIL
ncbi:phospholipid-translocating p-type flippase family protein, putative [Ichthyophthirius multifiliis]|uniref:Phospholipid-transporting ATPase n=1 Tax=Ichthyophthirius multifiliis TaxID=5932 RepID=G0QNX2_ICHMU|nr:phospholipid-translocating p-type flippase family protein, putative [Ichthyophthirius multifiliis]EGR33087.1 phospholipid-translocating p-type flippase family protein, putative [Ichthyophthirius multifiliis]|eukprot:XP_004037073.1 phospholipid-translocating p-type flippase family protein, putative [Ichthyophthirius multifiliis]